MKNTPSIAPGLTVVLLALLTLAVGSAASAGPVDRGRTLFGGGFSFSSAGDGYYQNAQGDRTQEWTVRPGGGYFVADGLALNFHFEGQWFAQGDNRRTSYTMGPVVEYYWDTTGRPDAQGDPVRGHVLPYLGLGYLWGQDRLGSADIQTKHNSGLVHLALGMSWMVSDHVATDISLAYRFGRFTQKVPEDGLARQADRWILYVGIKAFVP